MKRFWIRSLGVILAIFGINSANADGYNGAEYTAEGNGTRYDGYFSISASMLSRYGHYCPSGTDTYDTITECTRLGSGHSRCNNTGIYCTNSGFFTNGPNYCSYSSTVSTGTGGGTGNCIYTSTYWSAGGTYKFVGCLPGYFYSASGTGVAACKIGTSGISDPITSLARCCERCPNYSGTPDNGTSPTGTISWSSNCASGWCWERASDTVHNFSACKIYPDPSGTTYSGGNGTYTLPSGCPYVL